MRKLAAWIAPIALSAMGVALVGGVSFSREAPTLVTTSCSKLADDAQKLFDKGDAAVLSGRFTPGDHVHLTIDFKGVGYKYVLTGVIAEMPGVTGRGWWRGSTRQTIRPASAATAATTSIVSSGDLTGLLRMDLEIKVTAAGDGAIVISKTNSVPSLTSPRVVNASCSAVTPPTI